MSEYKVKRFENGDSDGNRPRKTNAQVIRVSDGKEMLCSPHQLSCAIRYAKDMNEKTEMGIYLIEKAA